MDLVLNEADKYLFDGLYAESLPRDSIVRQFLSLYAITVVGGYAIYFFFGCLSYWFVFDKKDMEHPRFLRHQVSREIRTAAYSLPLMTLFTTPIFVAEVRGHSKLYDTITLDAAGIGYAVFSVVWFLIFTDMCIYWIHRGLHHPLIYGPFHKLHHKWIVPTPFASHAFHPVDGFSQSFPYHLFVFLFPVQKVVYLGLFVFVQMWSVLIHDGRHVIFDEVINGAAHHQLHHSGFKYNYGQYFTFWDKVGGSYKRPSHQPKTETFQKEEAEANAAKRTASGKKRTE